MPEPDEPAHAGLPGPQHAALRRIAALVAGNAPTAALFEAVLREIMGVVEAPRGWLFRYEPVGALSILVSVNCPALPAGTRRPLDDGGVAAAIHATGAPARLGATWGVPIHVDGGLWGGVGVGAQGSEPPPEDGVPRLAAFTELVAGVIANAVSRDRLARLAEHRTALSRIATLVAEESPAAELFAAVMAEATRVLEASAMIIGRFEATDAMTVVASVNAARFPAGSRLPLDGPSLSALVYDTGRPARVDEHSDLPGQLAAGLRESGLGLIVGVPILAAGQIWGIGCLAMEGTGTLPAGVEERLQDFTDLLGLAIGNAESRSRTRRLAGEQAALRRVATLVAEGAGASELFSAVAGEVARVLDVASVSIIRFEPEATSVVVASYNDPGLPVGSRSPLDRPGPHAAVFATGRPARRAPEDGGGAPGEVAVPITVDGRVWGAIAVAPRSSRAAQPHHAGVLSSRLVLSDAPPHEVESRLAAFTQLVATAIANAHSRDQLTASRTRVLIEADEARRRVVRDLHDGAQQRLVQAVVTLKLAVANTAPSEEDALLHRALEQMQLGVEELRELAHGVLPTALTNHGLRAGLDAVVRRLDLPVDLDVPDTRFRAELEASAYFIVAEALTNVSKHAHATRADVRVTAGDGVLRIEVRDDGVGGADPAGHGLVGLEDRATTLGGRLTLESPAGAGTVLTATLPLSRAVHDRRPER